MSTANSMGESRQELLHWLNSLLQLNVTKVEQCGTGYVLEEKPHVDVDEKMRMTVVAYEIREVITDAAIFSAAFCQIFDSIYLDVPMTRVKFNVNTEYAYIQNFKILQNALTRHGIDRSVPVEQLVKCKLQDNLEFLQWSKRHWDQYFPGHEYDALARRKSSGSGSSSAPAPVTSRTSTGGAAARRPAAAASTGAARAAPRLAATGPASSVLKAENESLKEAIAGLEKERDFYFSKLRDIELLLQTAVENDPAIEKDENGLVKDIQTILYSTEEGFEIPAEAEEELEANGEEPETF